MQNLDSWVEDWHVAENDREFSRKLIQVFDAFLTGLVNAGLSKSTLRRHTSSCHALGGYILKKVFDYEFDSFSEDSTGEEVLLHYIDAYEGPLVFQDNEQWQKEIDATCKKLFKFIVKEQEQRSAYIQYSCKPC